MGLLHLFVQLAVDLLDKTGVEPAGPVADMAHQVPVEPGYHAALPRRQDAGERVSVPVQGEHISRRQDAGIIVRPEVRAAPEQAADTAIRGTGFPCVQFLHTQVEAVGRVSAPSSGSQAKRGA